MLEIVDIPDNIVDGTLFAYNSDLQSVIKYYVSSEVVHSDEEIQDYNSLLKLNKGKTVSVQYTSNGAAQTATGTILNVYHQDNILVVQSSNKSVFVKLTSITDFEITDMLHHKEVETIGKRSLRIEYKNDPDFMSISYLIPNISYQPYYRMSVDLENKEFELIGRATLINNTDVNFSNVEVSMVGGQQLEFQDLKKVDTLIEGLNFIDMNSNNNSIHYNKKMKASPQSVRFAQTYSNSMDEDMFVGGAMESEGEEDSQKLSTNVFKYVFKNIDVAKKSNSALHFMTQKGTYADVYFCTVDLYLESAQTFTHSLMFQNASGLALSSGKILVVNAFDDLFLSHTYMSYTEVDQDILVKLNKTSDVKSAFTHTQVSERRELDSDESQDYVYVKVYQEYELSLVVDNRRKVDSRVILEWNVSGDSFQFLNTAPKLDQVNSRTGVLNNAHKIKYELDLSALKSQTITVRYVVCDRKYESSKEYKRNNTNNYQQNKYHQKN